MVRETRHLWVGNLPDSIREDRIREHFKRYGRVQNVKLLGRSESASAGVVAAGASGVCATVAFMDIKSASKAHNAEHVVEERTLSTEYYEPAAIPAAAAAPSAGSSPAGSGYSGSSSSVNSNPPPSTTSRYHLSGGEESSGGATCPLAASAAAPANWRGTNDSATEYCRRGNTPAAYGRYQRHNSTAPYSTPPSNLERTTPLVRWYAGAGGESAPSTPGGGAEGARRRRSGSASSRSESSSPAPSDTSRASTPHHHAAHRGTPAASHQWAATASGRPLAICVRNLPTRSTDSSLKDGLYHEYKKHGKVVWVKVVGQNADRYAVVRFKKPSDVEKALEVSQDKLFFGCKISVAPHQSCDDDAESTKPYETDIDEYHPKATRTLFIGNLEKDVTQQQLRDKFKHFGRIIEIDIKKGSGGGAGYAFCQYASISSVVEAIRAMDGEYVGGSRVKLGFGKPVATACVWLDGLTEHTEKQVLGAVSRCGAATSVCVDRAAGAALVHFEQAGAAGAAVRELRRVAAAASAAEPAHPRLCVDYASRECQDAFYEQLERHGGAAPSAPHYSPARRAAAYCRAARNTRYPALDHYDPLDYAADRRYRVYDETGASPPLDDIPFEDRLQSVVVSPHRARRHRRDSTSEDRKHSKERHRSAGGGPTRSRSGSGARERHGARRRHRRRREGSGSRAGTPLRDEPEAAPAEPRRAPRDRPPLPMCLPLPKFAAQLLRPAPAPPRPAPLPAPAPDSPPRPPSASSSSAGSAPHSPSLEERIRSLDEKYEKWSGSRALAEAPDRARLRHRLLEVDINEVKPSEVVRSLLAKRSVFDEDTERLEGAGQEGRARPAAPDRPCDPRLNRPERPARLETLGKIDETEYGARRGRPRTPSTDRSQPGSCGRRTPPSAADADLDTRSGDSAAGTCDAESKSSFDADDKEMELGIKRERANSSTSDGPSREPCGAVVSIPLPQNDTKVCDDGKRHDVAQRYPLEHKSARDVLDMILKKVEQGQILDSQLDKSCSILPTDENKFDLFKQGGCRQSLFDSNTKLANCEKSKKCENKVQTVVGSSYAIKNSVDLELHLQNHKNLSINSKPLNIKDLFSETEVIKCGEKNDKDKFPSVSQTYQVPKIEKENIQADKLLEKEKDASHIALDKKHLESDKTAEDRARNDRDKVKHNKDRLKEKHECEKEKPKSNRSDKSDRDKKIKEETLAEKSYSDKVDKIKVEKDTEKVHKDKTDTEKLRNLEDKARHDHHKKEKLEKDKKRENEAESLLTKSKKVEEGRHKTDKIKKEIDIKREIKKESDGTKSRKSSRDESSREISRKDSTDSSTSRASHESSKSKDLENHDVKEEMKPRVRLTDLFFKIETEKDFSNTKHVKHESLIKIKTEIKEEKQQICTTNISKTLDVISEPNSKAKAEVIEKHRHHSLDSPSVESKRKERLNSCSSLPPNIGHKRRISSHDSFDLLCDDVKKNKNEQKVPERRESKDSRGGDRHKTTKFSKGHFAKIIESKTKEDKKNHVKPPDEAFTDVKESNDKNEIVKGVKKLTKEDAVEHVTNENNEEPHNNLHFLALFELRSSEEDERQKALRKEMKEKKRIQQLQQIQELQMQQDAMQQGELLGKIKDDKKQKSDDKKKEAAREKRFSTDRKSREEKTDNGKKKIRKPTQSSDTSDSDEPKKHSIFDIIDDGPTYISMYDKVKARSCKNMQKQEEEKRQEKIKAKFSQLKQSRAKREEKKRSSWDEDSDSENDSRRKHQKSSEDNSSDDENTTINNKRCEKMLESNIEFDENKTEDYYNTPNNEDMCSKLARKNSRTRIMSDSSDDDTSKSKSPNYLNVSKKFNTSDSESRTTNKLHNCKDFSDDHKKNSILNLFGKSDSEDSRLKTNLNENNYKLQNFKTGYNDLSSENESITSIRNSGELRRKHKKKPKKHKYSDEDNKIDHCDSGSVVDSENRFKISEKQHRHSGKKEKRKERSRESIDTDESREDKVKTKKERKADNSSFEYGNDVFANNAKRDGKMEDIFGPLSDESDKEAMNKIDVADHDFDSVKDRLNNLDSKLKERDDMKRKKEKKRKEKRWLREDDNSLDMDAVSKAIEARLFAESLTEDGNEIRIEALNEIKDNNDSKCSDASLLINGLVKINNKHEKLRRDAREKKKKRKRNKEERQNRKEHNSYYQSESYEKSDNEVTDAAALETITNTMLLDIPLPKDEESYHADTENEKSQAESQSLPILTESSPTLARSVNEDAKSETSTSSNNIMPVEEPNMFVHNKDIEIEQIPMPPPLAEEIVVQDISEVPLPKEPAPLSNEAKPDNSMTTLTTTLSSDSDLSEDAVRSISVMEAEVEKIVESDSKLDQSLEKIDLPSPKVDKKPEEKPRAIISQEETEDAVAALLGESFGGKVDSFSTYEEPENNSTHQNDIESTSHNTETIPEEDAEEMRQAVQNLNACEMELKPDTPVSDSDLLLIDTDTEEADETSQEASDKPATTLNTNKITINETLKPTQENTVAAPTVKGIEPVPTAKAHVSETEVKINETNVKDVKIQLERRKNVQIITSTATPVITSWTLTNKKVIEPHVINIQPHLLSNKDKNENKPHITTNIVQIKTSQAQNTPLNNIVKPVLTPTRVSAPYQVISPMVRPQTSNMHPPTIKIPEPQILYQKPQGIVISPRISNDPRLQSPKSSPQADGMSSPRLSNVAILSSSPQNINTAMMSPNSIHQRSPGQVTVVRVQQPPLSPIQALHMPHGTRAMVSPNRASSVLVQTQGSPLHFNRLPVAPVLTPITKTQINTVLQQNKGVGVTSHLLAQKIGDVRKNDLRNIPENKNENAKIILSPTSLQSTDPQVLAQNRLMAMQNPPVHIGNIGSPLHITNKVVLNKINPNDKRELLKATEHGGQTFISSPIIHVAGVNHSTPSIIQTGTKSVVCNIQDAHNINRGQGSNVIHTLNTQRLLTPVSICNIRQFDNYKVSSSVLSMANIRASTVLTKIDSSNVTTSATTSNVTNVTPILIKSGAAIGTIRINARIDKDIIQPQPSAIIQKECKTDERLDKDPVLATSDNFTKQPKPLHALEPSISKCETDFEELLKDNTNKIIITKDPEKKIEVNVAKNTTLITSNSLNLERQHKDSLQQQEQEASKPDQSALENVCYKEDKVKCADSTDKIDKLNIINEITQSDAINSKENLTPIEIVNTQPKDNLAPGNVQPETKTPLKTENLLSKTYENVTCQNSIFDFANIKKVNEFAKELNDKPENHIKVDDIDSWSTKDLNIESVIKKVDSLCNDTVDPIQTESKVLEKTEDVKPKLDTDSVKINHQPIIEKAVSEKMQKFAEDILNDCNVLGNISASKRGGRSLRGRKSEKAQDRVQTRQIAKPARGGTSGAKRGRGRAKVDKQIKVLANSNLNTIPGDVYDFHEDSGDEGSANKAEPRPRLILTIKSPLSGQAGVTATSTLSISQKDQNKLEERRPSKDDKIEDFVSPSPNTRKSRRLQEKDVHRGADDSGEDGGRAPRPAKRRPARQPAAKTAPATATATAPATAPASVPAFASAFAPDKSLAADTRKSPRGAKRTRDRSLSDASVDSTDGDGAREPKQPRLEETAALAAIAAAADPAPPPKVAPAKLVPAAGPPATGPSFVSSVSTHVITSHTTPPVAHVALTAAPAVTPAATPAPAPAAAAIPPAPAPPPPAVERGPAMPPAAPTPITKPPKKMISEISAKLAGAFEAALQHRAEAETGEAQAGEARRPATMPVGAAQAGEARVRSPALPQRAAGPPLARAEGEAAAARHRALSAGGCAAASLPRGAHHPPPPPHALHNHHYQGVGSRMTAVPSISPQGQIGLSADSIRSPPPAHQQTSPIPAGEGMYPHFSQQHYQMYQQHFRATQHDSRAPASPFTRGLEAEGCEAPTPPLELRRPPTARVPRPAHSPSPADRHIMYAVGCGRSPPPAHGVSRVPGALPPGAPPGPPHASQVPREADSLQMLLRRYPVMWQGLLALKNDSAAVQMHFVGGNPGVASDTLARPADLATPLLRIAQRMRLEPQQLDQVHRKMKLENEHCILLALPCGRDHMDVLQQSTNLTAGFITYLQRKCAAGIVNIAPPGHHQAMFTVHIFPSCEFANENLTRIAPDLMHRVADIAHLLIVIATV